MGFVFGLIGRLIKLIIYLILFAVIVTVIPNLPPYTKFTSVELEPTLPRTGPLARNNDLNNAEKLYQNKLSGPEALEVYNGEVYASLATGEVVKLSPGGHVTFVTKIGKPCQGISQPHICGRPLGFRIDERTEDMYVADAYYGIWKVNLKTDKKQQLVSPDTEIEGRKPMIFNAIALAKNGDFYWTDSSSDFQLHDGAKGMWADPSGRLIYYNAAKKQNKVLLENLWFSNGLAISPDNQFLVVSETCKFRLLKYYIDGPKKGKSEVFLAGLPGTPDNIKALPDGSGLQVGLYVTFDEENPLIARTMVQTPLIRKFLARLVTLIEMPLEFGNKHFPHVIFEEILYKLGSFESVSSFIPHSSALLQVDWNGNIVASYENTDGSLGHISDAVVYQGKLYTGSPHSQDYVGAVPAPPLLKKAYESKQAAPTPKTAQPVTEKIPKAAEKPKEAPKVAKPAPTQPPKQPEPVKTTTPKPAEKKPEPPTTKAPPPTTTTPPPKQPEKVKTAAPATPPPSKQAETKQAAPKQAEPKQAAPKQAEPRQAAPKQAEPKQAAPKQAEPKQAAPKQAEPKQAAPKQAEPKQAAPKQTEPKQAPPKAAEKQSQVPKPQEKQGKPVKAEIPITEEIPSDTRKPNKETLKVIKREGPTEIPNPEL